MCRPTFYGGIVTLLLATVLYFTAGDLQDQYIGCFSVQESQFSSPSGFPSSDQITIEICISSCKSYNATYAILQNGKQCRCGDTFRSNLSNDAYCNVPCSGNNSEYCGGLSSVTPYSAFYTVCPIGYYGSNCDKVCHCAGQIPCNLISGQCPNGCEGNWTGSTCNVESSNSGRYVGCYQDNEIRAMIYKQPDVNQTNPIGLCSSLCALNGTTYAAVQYFYNCFCGETYDQYGKLTEDSCSYKCAWDQSQICGRDWVNSVYSVCAVGRFGRDCLNRCFCNGSNRCSFNGSCASGCKAGWTGNQCNFRNCSVQNGDCSGNQTCVNIDLKYSSVTRCRCLNGYSRDTLWAKCTDTDECTTTPSVCNEATAICNNTIGSFRCICKPGFQLKDSNTACEDIDECQVKRCNSSTEQCMNTFGSFKCNCISGYERTDGTNCIDTDECQRGICDNSTTLCNNTAGGFECTCREGFGTINKTVCGTNPMTSGKYAENVTGPRNEGKIAGAVVGSVLGLILIIVAVCLIVYCIRKKRKRDSTFTDSLFPETSIDRKYKNQLSGQLVGRDVKSLFIESKDRSNAANIIREKLSNKSVMEAEFQGVPLKTKEFSEVGTKDELKKKNRFLNIIPYEWNRVVLQRNSEIEFSEYVNASYVQGYNEYDKFIAAQAPRKDSLNDFWRMIVEKEVRLIVMITNLIEEQKNKCEKYWPNTSETMDFGDVTVTLVDEDSWPDYTVRGLKVSKDTTTIDVMQFHYVAWPDHGTPTNIQGFLQFHRMIRDLISPENYTLVHCSAGAGRTGTFIAIDYLLEQAKVEDVDFHGCLRQLRDQRPCMIQNLMQYEFVHQAVLKALVIGDTAVPISKFISKYQSWRKTDESTGKSTLEVQFQDLVEANSKPEDSEIYRVLSSTIKEEQLSQMDAVYINSWKRKDAYLSIKMLDCVNEIWNLREEKNVDCVVFLENSQIRRFLPTKEMPIALKDYSLFLESESTEDYGFRCIIGDSTQETYANTAETIYENARPATAKTRITVLRVTKSLGKERENYEHLFSLFNAVESVISSGARTESPVMVVSSDSSFNGFCIAVFNAIEMIKQEQQVDLYQIVLKIRKSKPEHFSSLSSYNDLHDAVERYIRTSTI